MSFGLGFGGDAAAPGATGAGGLGGAQEAPGLSPMQAGEKLFGGSDDPNSLQNRAKKALAHDKIGDVDATTRAAATSLGNPDAATAENVQNAMGGIKDLALTGGKSLAGDAVGFLGGGVPAPGKLEQALSGGVANLGSVVMPATSPKEAIGLFRR